jgi:hypothetical protein
VNSFRRTPLSVQQTSRSYLSRLFTHDGIKSNDILGVILLLYSLLFTSLLLLLMWDTVLLQLFIKPAHYSLLLSFYWWVQGRLCPVVERQIKPYVSYDRGIIYVKEYSPFFVFTRLYCPRLVRNTFGAQTLLIIGVLFLNLKVYAASELLQNFGKEFSFLSNKYRKLLFTIIVCCIGPHAISSSESHGFAKRSRPLVVHATTST